MNKEEKMRIQEELIKLILVHTKSKNKERQAFEDVISAIKLLLNERYEKYNFDIEDAANLYLSAVSDTEFQQKLFKLNEKKSIRKQLGVYYTPTDVTQYILFNALINYCDAENDRTFNSQSAQDFLIQGNQMKQIINAQIFDPTCGTGEFLINAYEIKTEMLRIRKQKRTDADYLKILATIHGNDIEEESVDITKIRLFFEVSSDLKNAQSFVKAVEILNHNFETYDYLMPVDNECQRYDVIVGNPPYVEYGKSSSEFLRQYGNIYADVLENAVRQLSERGAIGFVVPLSYTATNRMRKIREFISNNTSKQIILSYADRPDCLFDGVHQKLCILFANKGRMIQKRIYTSNYKYWYSVERDNLLNGNTIIQNDYANNGFIPKIGNEIEHDLYAIVFTEGNDNILSQSEKKFEKTLPIYLNMRACFWMKAFTFKQNSSEYKQFNFEKEERDYILCILNSSLFWMYWTMVSDCWHITNKELKHFLYISTDVDYTKFVNLAQRLENEWEKTKEYIGTKQVDYAYKHSKCKNIIDEIDDELAQIYGLTERQLNYVKSFALKYRSSNGA